MLLTGLVQKAKFVVIDNADTLLTSVGAAGAVTTAVLTGRASFKAARMIDVERLEIREDDLEGKGNPEAELTKMTKVKIVWKLYIPPVGVGAVTVSSILLANRLSARRIAALALASGISERALQEYKTKVLEKFTDKQNQALHDDIAQDRVNRYPPNSREIIIAGTGEVLCYDMLTGRYFQSTVEEIKRAENKMNHQLVHQMGASLSEFYDEIGLPPTSYTDSVGWANLDHFEVMFSTVLSPDQRPCIAIDFKHPPVLEYSRRYHAD